MDGIQWAHGSSILDSGGGSMGLNIRLWMGSSRLMVPQYSTPEGLEVALCPTPEPAQCAHGSSMLDFGHCPMGLL
jgi:hypothetical protein